MHENLEVEAKAKMEAQRVKKKLEQDINDLEIAVDIANRSRSEVEKNVKKSVYNLFYY